MKKPKWALSAEKSRCCRGRVRISFGSAVLARCVSREEARTFGTAILLSAQAAFSAALGKRACAGIVGRRVSLGGVLWRVKDDDSRLLVTLHSELKGRDMYTAVKRSELVGKFVGDRS